MERIADKITGVAESLSGWIDKHPDIWRFLCGLREPGYSDVLDVMACVEESVDQFPELAVAATIFLTKNFQSAEYILRIQRNAVQ